MQRFLFIVSFILFSIVIPAQDTIQQIVPGRRNKSAQLSKPYVILISADGFRYDYAKKYRSKNLLALSSSGVKAASMIPSYPSLTFPNHYSIATGMYPAHHGLVHNQFYDRNKKSSFNMHDSNAVEDGSWYGGIPLWVLAEQQDMLTASYYFVGSEAPVLNTLPTYWYHFNDKTDINFRIDKVLEWLQLPDEKRPHLITFYISNVDHEGHDFGPDAPQTRSAVHLVDEAIGKMTEKIEKLGLPVNYIFLADHGMTAVNTLRGLDISSRIDTTKFIIKGGSTSLHLYAKDLAFIKTSYEKLKKDAVDYSVYLREEIPAKWHYNKSDDRFDRIGDIFIVPHHPMVLSTGRRRIDPGAHGFDPAIKDMHASFFAWGPAFKTGMQIGSFENIHVYPLVCRILGLHYEHEIDGNPNVLNDVLK